MSFSHFEILETIRMVTVERLDVRTVTLGLSLLDCADPDPDRAADKIYRKIEARAGSLAAVAREVADELGIPIVNSRISVTPLAWVAAGLPPNAYPRLAEALDRAARAVGVDFLGGYGALVHKGATAADEHLIASLPEALARTERVCAFVNVASTRTGINLDVVARLGHIIRDIAAATAGSSGSGCARLVVFANAVDDNPFMAGAFHGAGEPEVTLNVGVSGPGTVRAALEALGPDADLGAVAEEVKRTAFKITRAGELVGRFVARRLGAPFGIVDLSLAPTPERGDSVAEILQVMGVAKVGGWGSTAALALLTDAVKKGGAMASSSVGGLSGAFIPVSEDATLDAAVQSGTLHLEKLEAMTAVCSLGLDMIALPGDTPPETLSAIIADEAAIGVVNHKTTGLRLVPVPGNGPGDTVEFGGLLGRATIFALTDTDSAGFIRRGGRIPAPLHSLRN